METSEDSASAPFTLTGSDVEDAESALTVTVTTLPAHGSLMPTSGTAPLDVVYSTDANWSGLDSFEFTVTDTDHNESSPRRVTVTVSPVNDAPVITGQYGVTTAEDTPVVIDLSALVVADPDNVFPDDFTLTVLDGQGYTHAESLVTPDADFFGSLTVRVLVSDPETDSEVFDLALDVTPVNDSPAISSISASPAQTSHNGTTTITVTARDPDDDAETLGYAYSLLSGAGGISGTGASVTFNAGPAVETVIVQVVVGDGHGGEDTATVDIPVINRPPTISSVTPAPAVIVDNATCLVTVSAADPDGDALEYTYALDPATTAGGTLGAAETFVAANTVEYTPSTAGTAVVNVVVRDVLGAVASAPSATITVQASAPMISVRSCPSCAEIPPATGFHQVGTETVGFAKHASLLVRNTGTRDLHISGAALTGGDLGDFALSAPASTTVVPGAAITLAIEFAPSTGGERTATLSITSDDGDRSPYDVQLRGTGRTPVDLHVATTGSDSAGDGSAAAPYATVMKAMDVAVRGDRILVASGTYDSTFPGIVMKAGIALLGGYSTPAWTRNIAANVTTLRDVSTSGGTYGSLSPETSANPRTVVRIDGSDIQENTLLEGFTLEAGADAPYVAAVWVRAGAPVVRSNTIHGGSASGGSYGCAAKAVTLAGGSHARIEANTIVAAAAGSGGVCGVEVRDSGTDVVIHNNTIYGGSTTGADGGAVGIAVEFGAAALVDGNTVTNPIGPSLMAALSAAFDARVTVANNVIRSVAGGSGSIDLVRLYQSNGELINNTVFSSSAVTVQTTALVLQSSGAVVARNNLFYLEGSAARLRHLSGTVSLTFEYNFCYQDGTTEPYFTQAHNITSTLSTYVRFRDPASGDLHLTSETPVDLRAGAANASSTGVADDRDGVARTQGYNTSSGAPSNGGAGWSIGAYEQDG